MDKYEQPCDVMYHLFSDGFDEYSSDIEKILRILANMIAEHENIRIYKQTEWDEYEGIFEDGDCIFSIGQFPF